MRRLSPLSAIVLAGAVGSALLLSSCGGSDAGDGGPVTLQLSTFGNFGYTEEVIAAFEAEYPDIDVDHAIAEDGVAARSALFTRLAAGSGLADVEAVESGWTVDLRQYADRFNPVPEDEAFGDWLDFHTEPVETEDGRFFGYGVAIGPSAICYRADYFEAAGLPSEPAEVAALLEGGWEDYFQLGQQYIDAGGTGTWFDSADWIYRAQIEQLDEPYQTRDGEVVATTNPDVEEAFRRTLAAAETQSAGLPIFAEDWLAGTASGDYATTPCPSWMLGLIEGAAPDTTTWRIADAFPEGGGNVGGSYLVVPQETEHPEEAALLASWLTAPEQQVVAFQNAGPFPSRVDAYDLPELRAITNPYFGESPVGEIFIARSETIDSIAYKGPLYQQVEVAATAAMTRAEEGGESVDEAWASFSTEVEGLE